MKRPLRVAWIAVALCVACSTPAPPEPLALDGNRLIVSNQTDEEWTDVEVWLNTYYRVTLPYLAAGSHFQTGLDSFVAGYGQRFDLQKAPVTSLRLTARRPDGATIELTKQPVKGGLAGALEGVAGGRK
jgi:hypothetical protein